MEKLTSADEQELTWWFGTPAPAQEAGHIAAQSYDPKGSGFDPSTNLTLEKMVFGTLRRGVDHWKRVKVVLDRVGEGPAGRWHLEILRRAFGNPAPVAALADGFTHPAIAVVTAKAIERARSLTFHEEQMRMLEATDAAARLRGCSPGTVATRVYEAFEDTESRIRPHISDQLVSANAFRVLDRALKGGDEAFLSQVRDEMQAILDAAGDAYRRARKELGATRREAKRETQRAADASWDAYVSGKKLREVDRLNQRHERLLGAGQRRAS